MLVIKLSFHKVIIHPSIHSQYYFSSADSQTHSDSHSHLQATSFQLAQPSRLRLSNVNISPISFHGLIRWRCSLGSTQGLVEL